MLLLDAFSAVGAKPRRAKLRRAARSLDFGTDTGVDA